MDRKEAIEIVKRNWPDGRHQLSEALETLIPELKESEDERIRNRIIGYLKQDIEEHPERKERIEDMLAWLEKQGENVYNEELSKLLHEVICSFINNPNIPYSKREEVSKKIIPYVEKIEKQISQNLANSEKTCKDEQKFKVGDWVIHRSQEGVIYQVEKSFLDGTYRIVPVNDKIGKAITAATEDAIRLWTIQDAKDGDVLSFNDGHGNDSIELIKSITEKKIEFWFCLTNGNRYEVFDGITPYTNLVSRRDATPATKEQRDLLFQKMKEAGYEWDAEKKELNKIEHNSVIEMKSAEESLGIDSKTYNKIVDECIYGRQNSAWSEEDEEMLRRCISATFDHGYLKECDWLKSLKERYTWKPSDEQMDALDYVKNFDYGGHKATLVSLYEQLKKLKG